MNCLAAMVESGPRRAPLTEPYLCCSHTALQDDELLTPSSAGLRPRLSQCQRELHRGDSARGNQSITPLQ